jgi:Na+/H+ antiporter NhaA
VAARADHYALVTDTGDPTAASGERTPQLAGRTAWGRALAAPVRDFLRNETGGASVLFAAAVGALLWANSPWSDSYASLWGTHLSIRVGQSGVSLDLRHWVNQGLMTFFFLVAGLEAKRELDLGELRERQRLTLPSIAAIGGIVTPIAIYLAFNSGTAAAHGWGAAMSTDTAFALGVLALLAPGGARLRVVLLTLAIVDDLVALLVIATVYTERVSIVALAVALGLLGVLLALRYAPPAQREAAAAVVGVALWVALLESGVDPVITGLVVGLAIGAYPPPRAELERATALTRSFREQPTPELARNAQLGVASAVSLNERLQYRLHPWTSFVIVPLFALANAGIHIDGGLLRDAVSSPITLGIFFGYVVGKPLGIMGAIWIATRLRPSRLRRALTWPVIAGGATVAGIGFTVSLLVSSLAFEGRELDEAKLGMLAAAAVAFGGSWVVFRVVALLPESTRARQIRGTRDDLLDLVDDVDPDHDHVRGSDAAPVTLVEYGDYECPYCGQAEVVIRELLESFGDELRYVWRHLPLNDVHLHAQEAAEAAEAAAAQGAFWEMHRLLLDHQEALEGADLARYAERLDLDVERFLDELETRAHASRVAQDVGTADASGVLGTPTFFINGRRHRGAYDAPSLSAAVRRARSRARATAQEAGV